MAERPAVPMVDLKAQYARIKADVDAAVARVIESAHFIKGEDCALFEREFAAYCGAAHAVGVANGTDALVVALRAHGV
ncbi:MAG TPA: DegT/DnrJ/EryC1/StrS family aminotransferase, partial [Vicinamibacteria bacterium]